MKLETTDVPKPYRAGKQSSESRSLPSGGAGPTPSASAKEVSRDTANPTPTTNTALLWQRGSAFSLDSRVESTALTLLITGDRFAHDRLAWSDCEWAADLGCLVAGRRWVSAGKNTGPRACLFRSELHVVLAGARGAGNRSVCWRSAHLWSGWACSAQPAWSCAGCGPFRRSDHRPMRRLRNRGAGKPCSR